MKLDEKKIYRAIGEMDEHTVDEAAPRSLSEEYAELMEFSAERTEPEKPVRKITHIVTGVMTAAAAVACIAAVTVLLPKLGKKPEAAGSAPDTSVTQDMTEPAASPQTEASPLSFIATAKGLYVAGCSPEAESVEIPAEDEGVRVIGIESNAFAGCDRLVSITIPDTLAYFNHDAFSGTPWLEQKRAENPLVIVNGVLVDAQTCSGDVTVPDGVKTIGEYAFAGFSEDEALFNHGLTSVTLPASVSFIGEGAFCRCDGLQTVNLPERLQGIDSFAFSGTGLTEIAVPAPVKSIGAHTFENCVSLRSVTLPQSLAEIGEAAFRGCTALTEITMPSDAAVGEAAFADCPSLRLTGSAG